MTDETPDRFESNFQIGGATSAVDSTVLYFRCDRSCAQAMQTFTGTVFHGCEFNWHSPWWWSNAVKGYALDSKTIGR